MSDSERFPAVWLRLPAPHLVEAGEREAIAATLEGSSTVVDITSGPALWASLLAGRQRLSAECALDKLAYERQQASEHLEADLVSLLSATEGRGFFALFCEFGAANSNLVEGALEVLELARQDGLAGHIGISVRSEEERAAAVVRSHDAFDAALVDASHSLLMTVAHDRRLPVVQRALLSEPVAGARQVPVSTAEEVARALGTERTRA